MANYRQCRIERDGIASVCWLPVTFAIPGKFLELKQAGEWQNGWKVAVVYEGVQVSEELLASQKVEMHSFKEVL